MTVSDDFLSGFGGSGAIVGTTGMVGFEETLTDPSYAGQIVIMTAQPCVPKPFLMSASDAPYWAALDR